MDKGEIKKLKSRESISNYEKTNFDTIVFALSKNGEFWEIIENSALVMYNSLHDKLGLKTKMTAYQDYYTDRQAVRIAYHKSQMAKIEKGLLAKENGAVLTHKDDDIKIFTLKKPIAAKQFLAWRKTEEVKLSRRDALLEPSIHNPELSGLVRELGNEIILAVENMRASLRGTFDKKLVDTLSEIYDILAQEKIDKARFQKTLKNFGFDVSLLTDKRAIDEKRAYRIGVIIQDMKKTISVEISDRKANARKKQ